MKPLKIRNCTFGEGTPKICLPITGQTRTEILAMADTISALPCDAVEWRADHYEAVCDTAAVLETLKQLRAHLPEHVLLFTFRTKKEGGVCPLSDADYLALNCAVLESRIPDLLDLELFTGTDPSLTADDRCVSLAIAPLLSKAAELGIFTVLSNHDFEKTPDREELVSRLTLMEQAGASLAKIAVMPQSPEDVLTLLGATLSASEALSCPVITMSMGPIGMISRISGSCFGSCMTFGSPGKASAPGQLDAELLYKILSGLSV